MELKSKDFKHNSNFLSEFTCDGRNVSLQFIWEDVPTGTKSFALSFTDLDFSAGIWLHWIVYDISKDARQIERASLPDGGIEVKNTFGKKRYGGPCPPSGTHRYFFALYALDTERLEGLNKRNFFDKVEKHTLSRKLKLWDHTEDNKCRYVD